MSRGCTGSTSGDELLDLLRPHVERAGAIFDGLAPDERGRLSNDPDILQRELAQLGFADPAAAARHVADWRSGKARSLRSPAAQQAFEAMLPGLIQAIAAGADPDHALNRLSDIVERLSSGVNLFRLLEARPRAGAAAGQGPGARPGARRSARAPARIVRGAVRRVELRDAAARRASSPSSSAARCAVSLMTSRSTASGGWSMNAASRLACS